MQLFSECESNFTALTDILGLYFQIRDDYANLCMKEVSVLTSAVVLELSRNNFYGRLEVTEGSYKIEKGGRLNERVVACEKFKQQYISVVSDAKQKNTFFK